MGTFENEIRRGAPDLVIHSFSKADAARAEMPYSRRLRLRSRLSGLTRTSKNIWPFNSALEYSITCSQARLQRTIRPWASSTTTRAPQVCSTAMMKSRSLVRSPSTQVPYGLIGSFHWDFYWYRQVGES